MKRKREVEIICQELKKAGVPISIDVEWAVHLGLKHVRAEEYKERESKKSR